MTIAKAIDQAKRAARHCQENFFVVQWVRCLPEGITHEVEYMPEWQYSGSEFNVKAIVYPDGEVEYY